jgi:hypothetical protein
MRKPDDLLAKLKAFELANPSHPGPKCTVCRLPALERAFVDDGRKQGAKFRAIAAVLAGEGHRVSHYTIARHVRDGHGES